MNAINIAVRALIFTLLASSAARADGAIEEALRGLGAPEAAKRDEAEAFLKEQGEEAEAMCRGALAVAADADLKARLERICRVLAGEERIEKLAAAWKDRWFLVSEGGVAVGWEHETAKKEEKGGRKTWVFVTESRTRFPGFDKPVMGEVLLTVRCGAEADWPLIEADVTLDVSTKEEGVDLRIAPNEGGFAYMGQVRERGKKDKPLRVNVAGAAVLDCLVAPLVERASLARRRAVELTVAPTLPLWSETAFNYRARFAGEEAATVGGRELKCRLYVHDATKECGEDRYWVNDECGLVRAHLHAYDSDRRGYEIELSDEAAAKKALEK